MKKILLIAACSFMAFSSKSQTNTDEVALLQSAYGLEKKQIIVQYMKFTEAENASFWKIYDEYEVSRKDLGKKRIENITQYANNYTTLTNEKATELVKASLNLHISFAKLQESTFTKLTKVMSPLRAAQWIQLEVYLENMIRMEIADEIPMIGELEKTQKK